MNLPQEIFRAYDIRGIAEETLTTEGIKRIGIAFGDIMRTKGCSRLVIGRDGRHSGPSLQAALMQGLQQTGVDIVDIGMVPTPVLYFAVVHFNLTAGIMLTGSHNPAYYNGLKMILEGDSLYGEHIQALYRQTQQPQLFYGCGQIQHLDILGVYQQAIVSRITLKRELHVVVDSGNGAAGLVAPALYKKLGCRVTPLFCEVDGRFPNHHPDPVKPDNLIDLQNKVLEVGADCGIAFDGDADRIGVIDNHGKIIWGDRLLSTFAIDLLTRQKHARIIYDVKCSNSVRDIIKQHGGEPTMSRTGHSYIKAKMKSSGAWLAGEMSGHIFFRENWYNFDDAIYAGALLMQILTTTEQDAATFFQQIPEYHTTPEFNIDVSEQQKFLIIAKIIAEAEKQYQVNTLDGLRIDLPDAWGIVRASNTNPYLTARFEGNDDTALYRIQQVFRKLLLGADTTLVLPFQ